MKKIQLSYFYLFIRDDINFMMVTILSASENIFVGLSFVGHLNDNNNKVLFSLLFSYKCKKSFTICIYYVFRKKKCLLKGNLSYLDLFMQKWNIFYFFSNFWKECAMYILECFIVMVYFIIHLLNVRYNIYYLLKNSSLRKLRINNDIYKNCLYLQCTFQ